VARNPFRRRPAPSSPPASKPWLKVIRLGFVIGFVAGFLGWRAGLIGIDAFSVLSPLFVAITGSVVGASVAIEIEHAKRWAYPHWWSILFHASPLWILAAFVAPLLGAAVVALFLNSTDGDITRLSYEAALALKISAAVLGLAAGAVVWRWRVWISERRLVQGPQFFAEVTDAFAAMLNVLNRVVHLFTGLAYLAAGAVVLLGLRVYGWAFLQSGLLTAWSQTIAVVAVIVGACFCFANGFQRLVRAISVRPSATIGPHGSAYTATAADLRRAGILR
jgi:hypothetical protein